MTCQIKVVENILKKIKSKPSQTLSWFNMLLIRLDHVLHLAGTWGDSSF